MKFLELLGSARLSLNSDKTEFLWCMTSRRCSYLDTRELSVWGSSICPVTVAHNLGVMLKSDLSMKDYMAQTASRYFHQLCLLKDCIKSLPFKAARAAVAAFFFTSQVDHYNSLLVGTLKCLVDCLQSVLNAAVRLLCNWKK